MVPYILEVELERKPVEITVEQLERFTDVDGFSRYDITLNDRRSVVKVNVTAEPVIVTPRDAEACFEAMHYPEQPVAYDEQEVFAPDELRAIAAAIRQYNRETRVVFAQFLMDF